MKYIYIWCTLYIYICVYIYILSRSDRFCGIFCLAFLLLARGQFDSFCCSRMVLYVYIVVVYARVRIGCPGSCLIFEGHFMRVSGFWVLRHIQFDSSLHWHPLWNGSVITACKKTGWLIPKDHVKLQYAGFARVPSHKSASSEGREHVNALYFFL